MSCVSLRSCHVLRVVSLLVWPCLYNIGRLYIHTKDQEGNNRCIAFEEVLFLTLACGVKLDHGMFFLRIAGNSNEDC